MRVISSVVEACLARARIEDHVPLEEPRGRVLIVSRLFAPEPSAASLRLGAAMRALIGDEFDVDVLTTSVGGAHVSDTASGSESGVRISRWPVLRNRDGYVRGYLGYLSFDLPVFFRLLVWRRPDVVICEPPPTTGAAVRLACALRGIPFLYYAADLWSEAVREVGVAGAVQRVLAAVERWALEGAIEVLTVSPAMVDRLRDFGVRSRVTMVGHGADENVFRPDGPSGHDSDYLVYVGTASEVHGARIFTQAWRRVLESVPEARLVIIGQGTERPWMEEDARGLPAGAVEFLPRVDPAEAASWLRGAKAALASIRPGPYAFAVASKVYAAAGCGTPVVHVGPGPGRDLVVENELGRAVDYDVDQVADAMIEALRAAHDEAAVHRRSGWTRGAASLQGAARRVAGRVRAVANRGSSG